MADLRKNIIIITLPVTILTNLIFGGLAFAAAKDERRSAHGISIDENGKVKKSLGENGELPSFVREALPIAEEGKKKIVLTYPSSENEYFTLTLKKEKKRQKEEFTFEISSEKKLRVWGYRGVTGFKLKNGKKGFLSLSDKEVKLNFRK